MSASALVSRPVEIPGLRSWSLELAGSHPLNANSTIAVHPQGNLIAVGNLAGKISLFDRDGNFQRALLGHEGWVRSLDFSSDGHWLASCDQVTRLQGSDSARVWNVETGALQAVVSLPGPLLRVKFSPNSEQLAVTPSILIIDLTTGRTRSPEYAVGAYGLAWSPDGTELASSHSDNHLRVWNAKTLTVLRDAEAPLSSPLEWSPDGQWLALRNANGQVGIRDAKTLELKTTAEESKVFQEFHSLAWLSDSRRLLVAQVGQPSAILDAVNGQQLVKFDLPVSVSSIAAIPKGQEAVTESQGRLHFLDTATGQKLRESEERAWHAPTYAAPALSADGLDAFLHCDNKVYVAEAETGERKRTFSQLLSNVVSPHPSPDLALVGILAGLPTLQVVDAKSGASLHELPHDQAIVTGMVWSPDGKWLTTGATDKLMRVWNVATGKIEHQLAGHTGTVRFLAWSPDGNTLASTGDDKTVRLWNPREGKFVATFDQFPEEMNLFVWNNLAWSSDSSRLWIALNTHIIPLDVKSGTFGPMENFSNGNNISFLNMSPNGQRLLARENYRWTFLRGNDGQDNRLLGRNLGTTAQWHPDSRRFLGWEEGYATLGFDVETNRRLGLLFPWLTGDHWLCIGPTGHYRGSPGVESQFVYVALHDDGSQRTYTPTEFADKFGWKNDAAKATLLKLLDDK